MSLGLCWIWRIESGDETERRLESLAVCGTEPVNAIGYYETSRSSSTPEGIDELGERVDSAELLGFAGRVLDPKSGTGHRLVVLHCRRNPRLRPARHRRSTRTQFARQRRDLPINGQNVQTREELDLVANLSSARSETYAPSTNSKIAVQHVDEKRCIEVHCSVRRRSDRGPKSDQYVIDSSFRDCLPAFASYFVEVAHHRNRCKEFLKINEDLGSR